MSAIDIALQLIKKSEGCRLGAYRPVPGDPWTIGWGATGEGIQRGTVWTQEQADADLQRRVTDLCAQVRELITAPVNDYQLGAMIDLAYNIGIGNFSKSTLLTLFNAGSALKAADEFLKWNKSHGVVLPGLVSRREEERVTYLRGVVV